jgi:hypothetical protein
MIEQADGRLRIHLLFNRASPWADVDSCLPYAGRVEVKVRQSLTEVVLRVPEFLLSAEPLSRRPALAHGDAVRRRRHSRLVSPFDVDVHARTLGEPSIAACGSVGTSATLRGESTVLTPQSYIIIAECV